MGGATVIFFYFSTAGTAVLMFHQAATGGWKRLMVHFEKVEQIFTDESLYPAVTSRWTLRRKIATLSAVVLITCTIEHGFYLLAKMTNVWKQIKKCKFKIDFYEHFIRTERKQLYPKIPFSYYIAVPFEITNTCNTLAWTFLDLFIMMYSLALAHRFEQITRRIRRVLLEVIEN